MKWLIAALLTLPFLCSAQLTIQTPLNKSVFQRTGSGTGSSDLFISGNYAHGSPTSIQARLLDLDNGATVKAGFDWTVIDAGPTKGFYFGKLNAVPAGWYTLEVRSVRNGVLIESSSVSRVGVGDVFLISGQSNAAGWPSSGFTGSSSEKVNIHDLGILCISNFPVQPVMEQLLSNKKIATQGKNGWAYGRLGDLLTQQTGFPVAFFNGAADGSHIENWTQSMNGQATFNPFSGNQFCHGYPNAIGQPYTTLKTTFNFYNSFFGARALLWHQGESDTYIGTSTSNYETRLTSLIARVRSDMNTNSSLPWVVSRASYYNGNTSAAVILGQNNVINADPQVYAGPSTDNITGPNKRNDNTHFNDQGILELADGWFSSLNPSFFSSSASQTVPAKAQPQITASQNGTNVTLTAPSGYATYKWVNGTDFQSTQVSTAQSITVSSGTYRCFASDNKGNLVFSQQINVSTVKSSTDNLGTCSSFTYLSDLKPFSISNGFGPIAFDQSNGGLADGDGSTIQIGNTSYIKGIGMHAPGEIVYKIPNSTYYNLLADIGVDESVQNAGTIRFQVINAETNTILYESATLTGSQGPLPINVNIQGVSFLKLKVLEIENNFSDHANWGNVRISCQVPETIPPSLPTNLAGSSILTKCFTLNWTASTDNSGVLQYNLFKDGVFQTSVNHPSTSHSFTGLTPGTSVEFGVQAVDIFGNKSDTAKVTISLPVISVTYASNDVCVNTNNTPTNIIPLGGVFSQVIGPGDLAFSSTTGTFTSPTANFYRLIYTVASGTSCEDNFTINLRTNEKPAPTTISGGPVLANVGTSINFSSSGCAFNNAHIWSTGAVTQTLSFSAANSIAIFTQCRNNGCFSEPSNTIQVNVIPDCPQSFTLSSTANDLSNQTSLLFYKASQTIQASNSITNSTINYSAGNSIIFTPGFKVEGSSTFTASIQGCP